MIFKQQVIEQRAYDVIYYVEAENAEEAENEVAEGNTLREVEVKLREVTERDPWDDPVLVDALPAEENADEDRAAALATTFINGNLTDCVEGILSFPKKAQVAYMALLVLDRLMGNLTSGELQNCRTLKKMLAERI